MSRCGQPYSVDDSERTCQRPVHRDRDRCVFHLTPAVRRDAGIASPALREAVLADIAAEDPSRREYVDVELTDLDLSSLVLDGHDVDRLTFRNVRIEGTFDLSGSVVRHPIEVVDSAVGRLDASDGAFEMDVTVEGSAIGTPAGPATCLRARRSGFEQSLRITDTRLGGNVELAACRVAGWFDFDGVTVTGRAHFPNVTFGRAQFVSTAFEGDVEFEGATGDHVTFEQVGLGPAGGTLALSGTEFEVLRISPGGSLECDLTGATVSGGRLDQPADAVARYDLTDAVLGDVALDCEPATFDRYRFYRTRFDGFPFASYREVLRANRFRLHEYVGDPAVPDTVEGLEHTYLEAKQGASESGDSESGSMFFVRELRYRRRRYADHARRTDLSTAHRFDATVRWLTNGFLDLVAGYGERPQRTLLLSLAVIVGSALAYPATEGLTTGQSVVRYASHGPLAAFDGLYFSVVTFATLGLGDVHPVGDIGRFVAASEGLVGAFLTAVFVFSLGRRVTR